MLNGEKQNKLNEVNNKIKKKRLFVNPILKINCKIIELKIKFLSKDNSSI